MKKIWLNVLLFMTLLSVASPISSIVQAEPQRSTAPITLQDPLKTNGLTEQTESISKQKETPIESEQLINETPSTPQPVEIKNSILENKLDTIIPSTNVGIPSLLTPTATLENYAVNQYYNSVVVQRIEGNSVTTALNNGDTIDYYDQFSVTFNWSVPNSATLAAGDVIKSNLPIELKPLKAGPVDVVNKNGQVVGSWKIVTSPLGEKTLEFTVNQAFTELTDRSGIINFTAQLDFNKVENKDQTINLNFDTSDQRILTLNVKKAFTIDPNERLYKFGQVDPNDPETVIWSIRVNFSGQKSGSVVIQDVPEQQKYMPDRIWADWGQHNKDTGEFSQSEAVPSSEILARPGGGFEVHFGDLGETPGRESGIINVAMKANDGGAAGKYYNRALYSENRLVQPIADVSAATPTSGGEGGGDGKPALTIKLVNALDHSQGLDDGSFIIYKVEADGSEFPVSGNYTTVAGVTVAHLDPGKYRVLQSMAAPGYALGAVTTQSIDFNDNTELTFYNVAMYASARLTKVDAADPNIKIPGATFKFINTETGDVVKENLKSNALGVITISELVTGKYAFVETEAAPGYTLDETPIPVSIIPPMMVKPGDPIPFNPGNDKVFTNKTSAKEFSLIKKDKANPSIVLPDAHFDLYKEGEIAPIKTDLVTDANGLITIPLEYGDYYFQETVPPAGYVLDKTKQAFTVSPDKQNPLEIFNEKQRVTMLDSQLPDDLNFGTHPIQNSTDEKWLATADGNQTNAATKGILKVDDNRSITSGWKLTAKQLAQFKNGTTELEGARLLLTAEPLASTASVIPSNGIQGTTATLIPNTEKIILGANENEGHGLSTLELSKFELIVPKTATKKIVNYSSSIVWTLSDTP